MTRVGLSGSPLVEELRSILAGLDHARGALDRDAPVELDGLWSRADRLAQQVDALNSVERDSVKPIMLALLDELERTIEAFAAERRDLGGRLKSTSRSVAADAAYRQIKAR